MGFIEKAISARTGVKKAVSDCRLAEEFLATHNFDFDGASDIPEVSKHDMAHGFFQTLGTNINAHDQHEVTAYKTYIQRYQRRLVRRHPELVKHTNCWFNGILSQDGTYTQQFQLPGGATGTMMSIPIDNLPPEIEGIFKGMVRAKNLEAGKCLGCGGGITPEGDCDGEESGE